MSVLGLFSRQIFKEMASTDMCCAMESCYSSELFLSYLPISALSENDVLCTIRRLCTRMCIIDQYLLQ